MLRENSRKFVLLQHHYFKIPKVSNRPLGENSLNLGPMLWLFKYFRQKIQQKMAFLTPNKAKLCKILIITLVFEKNDNIFAENWQKSPKIVIITSTSGHPVHMYLGQNLDVSYSWIPTLNWWQVKVDLYICRYCYADQGLTSKPYWVGGQCYRYSRLNKTDIYLCTYVLVILFLT
jgi:hypothetical protein